MSALATTQPATSWWVNIDRENNPNAAVGPYPDEAAAGAALESLLVESLCEEDAIDAYTTSTPPNETTEQFIVDLSDPDHTGT